MKRDELTKLTLQETKDEDLRMRNMQEKVIIELCGKYGRVKDEQKWGRPQTHGHPLSEHNTHSRNCGALNDYTLCRSCKTFMTTSPEQSSNSTTKLNLRKLTPDDIEIIRDGHNRKLTAGQIRIKLKGKVGINHINYLIRNDFMPCGKKKSGGGKKK